MSLIARIFNFFMAGIVAAAGLLFTGQPPKSVLPAPVPGALTQYVNPFVGTGAIPWESGMTNPGATAPFGRVQLSPDTCFPFGLNIDRVGTGGYWYGKTHTYGFSHNRVSGAGLIEGGQFRVTPGLDGADPLQRMTKPLVFGHMKEKALPGYYMVWLPEAACLAELTATVHTGVHRYTFASGKDAHLFLDATSKLNGNGDAGTLKVVDNKTLEGSYNGQIYFRAEFSAPFEATLWRGGELIPGETEASQEERGASDVGADLNFGDIKDKPLTLWLGISYVSQEGARANLAAESAGKTFDQVYAGTRDDWNSRLGSIKLETNDAEIKRIFYTALYHCMIHPSDMTDVDGKYLGYYGFIGDVSKADYTYRSDLSLWDTFRTTHPLYCLIAPDIQRDTVQSLLRMAEKHGGFPKWPKGGGDGGSMFGTPAHIVMAESYLKGFLSDADAKASLQFMKDAAYGTVPEGFPFRGRDRFADYNALGYCPSDNDDISVSRTLEYAWADFATANMAEALGDTQAAAAFRKMSMNFKNLYDPSTKYFRPRNSAGEWQRFSPWITTYYDELLPVSLADGFSEGSARHYRWHAVQDPQWLVEQMGKDYFVSELEKFMKDATPNRAGVDPGSGWWVGNQHNYHVPYMFNEAGRPDLTQKWVRWTLTDRYADSPDGIDGNEDLGALSAWYVFSALGFYPIAGSDRYWLGSPIVDKAALDLGGGKTLTVIAENQGPKNMYVKSVTFNGAPLEGTSFSHSLIKGGGTLKFVMSDKP